MVSGPSGVPGGLAGTLTIFRFGQKVQVSGMLVKQIHHYSMKCASQEEADKVKAFYAGLLGMTISTEWDQGFMLDCGGTFVEVFTNGEGSRETGALRHIAFAVEDADACAKAVRDAGYEVFLGPKDIVLPVPARIAFCFGPLGEQVEFFQPHGEKE